MLYHHDGRSYQEAASEAAAHARIKLEKLIEDGRQKGAAVIETVQNNQPTDAIIRGASVKVTDELLLDAVIAETEQQRIHKHALDQMSSAAGIKEGYARFLQDKGDWGKALLAQNLNTLFEHDEKRHLVRVVNGEVRGFLSDAYRRLDARPLIDSFCATMQLIGALPIEGSALDTKISLKAILPKVFEPVADEVLAVGMQFSTSDYGDGALSLRMFILRLWCTNYAVTEETMRQVHLGRRLDENFVFSQKTYELDTQATASAVRDVVRNTLGPAKVNELINGVKAASEQKIDAKEVNSFLKARLNKTETASAIEKFNSAEIEMLPKGNTMWRLSNAVSWLAGETEDKSRSLELEKVAGELLVAYQEKAAA